MKNDVTRASAMLDQYINALRETQTLLDATLSSAIDHITQLSSILVVTGLGKSGLIAQKAAATLSSTGTRAVFIHPVEALHGDLGIVNVGSALLAISKSGSNTETIEFARQFRSVTQGKIISISEPESKLAELADIALFIPKVPEIDDWDLAPTTSSVTSLALCDILAICVQQEKGLKADDFARYHPSGALGKRLFLSVADLMVQGTQLPTLEADASFVSIIYEMSSKGYGLVLLTNEDGTYYGMLTDGDIRRLLERREPIMTMNGIQCFEASRRGSELPTVEKGWVTGETKAIDCLKLMEDERITSLVILNSEKPIGLVRMQDLVAAGL